MTPTVYDKLLTENITSKYKLADDDIVSEISHEFNDIAQELNISERIENTAQKQAFVTIKDHKHNFEANTKCRLINPTKSEMGRVSKVMLDRINNDIRCKIGVNQWKDTSAVLKWFNGLKQMDKLSFLVFDIEDFYPSITEDLLKKCLRWAKKHTTVTDTEHKAILHSRRSTLHDHKDNTWIKKDARRQFDVSMGAHDGAEVCELVGLYILEKLKTLKIESVGLYRDDGLAVMRACSGSQADRIRKDLTKIFKDCGLKITAQTNLKSVDYLDVTLNLNTGLHKPFRKPNNDPVYINKLSNHPPSIIENLPKAIAKRVSETSSNQDTFQNAAPMYNQALKNAGYKDPIKYVEKKQMARNQRKRKRVRRVIWYNPPFSKNVRTNIGAKFLSLVDRHFPRGSKLNKIFNRFTLKVSYSCMKNIKQIIKSHNSQIMEKTSQSHNGETTRTCNCRRNQACPLRGNCLVSDIIYKATVKSTRGTVTYVGLCSGEFKKRYYNHTKSFKNKKYQKETELSKYIWDLKTENSDFSIKWDILKKSNTGKRKSGMCNLCMEEKLHIISLKNDHLLNKRNEMPSWQQS